jgi:tetratricopeptide (TPR) repeat protein
MSANGTLTSSLKALEAGILEAEGKFAEAAKAYETACNMQDASLECYLDLARLLKNTGNRIQSRDVLRVAFRKFPESPLVLSRLGLALLEEGHITQAGKLVAHALKCGPDNLEALEFSGLYYRTIGRPELATDYLQTALKTLPPGSTAKKGRTVYVRISLQLAEALKECGDMEPAERVLRSIINKAPESSRAWLMLSDMVRFKRSSPEIKRMNKLLESQLAKQSASTRVDLNFALGKAWMDIGDPTQAFNHLTTANQLYRSLLSYDIDAVCRRLENYGKSCAPAERFSVPATPVQDNADSPSPVFIVGMPRSGTSLIEQILATHPEVYGAGELTSLPRLKNKLFGLDFPDAPDSKERASSKQLLSELAKQYLHESRQYLPEPSGGCRYLIDKMPGNFMFCGIISAALPHAKIIHCRRNPIDTCLSCYSKYFVAGQSFSYNLTELGQYYRSYQDLMSYWRQTLPKHQFLEVDYENVVADIETETRRLTNFLDIEWSPEVLSFHETKRSVRTASSNQVRKPIYSSSVERWRPYKKELAPLFDALGIMPD